MRKSYRRYAASASVAVLSLLLSAETASARQQTEAAGSTSDADVVETIVVTGVRASLRSAQAIKRDSSQIVDSIVAEDIGKLPDNNVAEALQRITGVQISRSQGEGSGIAIRGLSQVQTLLNGRNLFTTSGRGVAFGDIPAELLAGLDVYKTSAADQIEGGLGGVVNIRLRRPFDLKDSEVVATARAFYGDIADKADPRVSILASKRWDTGMGEVGALISAVYQKRSFGSYRSAVGAFAPRTDQYDLDGDGVFPNDPGDAIETTTDVGTRSAVGSRERVGINTSLQWRPAQGVELYFDGLYNTADNKELDQLIYGRTGTSGIRASAATAIAPFTFRPGTHIFQSGRYADVKTTPSTYVSPSTYDTWQGVFGGSWTGERLTVSAEAGYTYSSGSDRFTEIGTKTNAPNYTVDLLGFINPTFGGVNLVDPGVYEFDRFADSGNHNKGDEIAGKFEVNYRLDGVIQSVQAGLRIADRGAHRAGYNASYTFTAANNLPRPATINGLLVLTKNNLFRGRGGLGVTQWATPSVDFLSDPGKARQLFGLAANGPADDPRQFYDISEKTSAGFVKANFAFTAAGLEVDGNAGVRYVETSVDLTGFQSAQAGGFSQIKVDNEYGDWLPSFNARVKLTPTLFLRAAASKVVTRPSFAQLTPATTLNFLFNTGSGGNPQLQPLRADQYDLSLEWYPTTTSNFYVATFRKNVDGFIQNLSANQVIDGVTYLITSPRNGASGKVKGLEVGGQVFFDFLPEPFDGLGVQANYTFVDSAAPSPIIGQTVPLENLSRNSYNLIGIYEKGPLSVRLAYNWRDKYVSATTGDAAQRPLIVKAQGQLDASISYDVSERLSLSLDATNLTRNALEDYYGSPILPKSFNQYDRTFELGMRMKF